MNLLSKQFRHKVLVTSLWREGRRRGLLKHGRRVDSTSGHLTSTGLQSRSQLAAGSPFSFTCSSKLFLADEHLGLCAQVQCRCVRECAGECLHQGSSKGGHCCKGGLTQASGLRVTPSIGTRRWQRACGGSRRSTSPPLGTLPTFTSSRAVRLIF